MDSFGATPGRMTRKALITGAAGQDGRYLAELLLSKGYEVHGLIRRGQNPPQLDSRAGRLVLHAGDLMDPTGLAHWTRAVDPDEVYNLAAISDVGVSYSLPEQVAQVNGLGALRILEAIRAGGGRARFFQASSADMFGAAPAPQNEDTPFRPESPYGAAKLFAHWMTVNYREAHGLYACSAILMNHESPRRPERFVTRKITRAVAQIRAGLDDELPLGNLEARRDWGYAAEYVEAMWRMLQQEEPADFVIATGESHTVKEFVHRAFARAGLDWERYVRPDPGLFRPLDAANHVGDITRAKKMLGWEPRTTFEALVDRMVDADLEQVRRERPRVKPGGRATE